jgi:biopolymer transport protein ExbB/TolQ
MTTTRRTVEAVEPDLAALTSVGGLVGPGSIFVLMLVLLVRNMRQNTVDREQYRQHIVQVQQDAADHAAEREEAHRQAIIEFKEEVRQLRVELRASREEAEAERRARWAAEDTAAEYRRQLETIRRGHLS